MKKHIFYYLLIFLFLIITYFTVKIILFKNAISKNQKIGIEKIRLSTKEINLKNLNYKEKIFSVNINELKIKPSLINNAFAFNGPGELSTNFEKRKISVEGKIKGNFINGNVNIVSDRINIENIGNIKFYGTVENWGKEKFQGTVELNGLQINQIIEITKYSIPFDGKIYGKIFIEKEKENLKNIRFNLEVKEISLDKETKFYLFLKGSYIPTEKRAIIEDGILINEKNEKISFNGYFTDKEFEIQFNTKEFSIEEFMKILPQDIIKKYNLKIQNSKISMNNFHFKSLKKNFSGMENLFLMQKV